MNDWIAVLEHPDEDHSQRIDRLVYWIDEAVLDLPLVWMTLGEYERIEASYFTNMACGAQMCGISGTPTISSE